MNIDELIERMRVFEADHEPDGWPAIRMREVSALCDSLLEQQAEIAALMEELEQAWGERNEAVASKVNDEAMFMAQLAALKAELAAAHRAGMLAAAELCVQDNPRVAKTDRECAAAIREAAKR